MDRVYYILLSEKKIVIYKEATWREGLFYKNMIWMCNHEQFP